MILISPYSARLRSGKPNPKVYPWWPELIALLGDDVVQIGTTGEERIAGVSRFMLDAPFHELRLLIAQASGWLSVDNFLPHFINADCAKKPGIVLWGQSDPRIFGYPQNRNLLKGHKYLRQFQFDSWEAATYDAEAFVSPQEVIAIITEAVIRRMPPPSPMIAHARFDM